MHQLSRAVTALAAQGPRRPGPLVMFTLVRQAKLGASCGVGVPAE
jgi:hypothetical protein